MELEDRLRGVAVGAAIGDALGMPLEFKERVPSDRLVREMQPGRIPAGSFTDDTEMALALADSLLERYPLDPDNLAGHLSLWYRTGPSDVGIQTSSALRRIEAGERWRAAAEAVQASRPNSAGNGSVMRCWPVALAYHRNQQGLLEASELQGRITHPHVDCVAGSCLYQRYDLSPPARRAARRGGGEGRQDVTMPDAVRSVVEAAPTKARDELQNTGWVRHTLESAVWGLLTTNSFEEAVVQVANLGNDADTGGPVLPARWPAPPTALAAIPSRWRAALGGQWPVGSGNAWDAGRFADLADRLAALWIAPVVPDPS